MELIKKAYRLYVKDLVNEPWHYDDIIVYADTAGEAKSKGLIEFDGAELEDWDRSSPTFASTREVKFTDIKATRLKEFDKYLYEGKEVSKKDIHEYEWVKNRDKEAKELAENCPDRLAFVYAGCYGSYWGANRSGYADNVEFAGKYTTQEAYDIVRGSDYSRQETVILIDVEKFNRDIEAAVEKLEAEKQRLISKVIK